MTGDELKRVCFCGAPAEHGFVATPEGSEEPVIVPMCEEHFDSHNEVMWAFCQARVICGKDSTVEDVAAMTEKLLGTTSH